MREDFTKLTADCRSLNLQSTDLKAQCQIVKQAVDVGTRQNADDQKLSSILNQLENTKELLSHRDDMNTQLETIKTRIRELKKLNEDQSIEEKVFVSLLCNQRYQLQLKRQEEEVEELRKKVVLNTNSTNELMQTLSAEYAQLQAAIEGLQKEESETELQLSTLRLNVSFRFMDHSLEGKHRTEGESAHANPCRVNATIT